MKRKVLWLLVAAFGLVIGIRAAFPSSVAFAESETTDMLSSTKDWIFQQNAGFAGFNDEREIEIIGVGENGGGGINSAVYTKRKYGSGKISFDFQLDFGPGVSKDDYQAGSEWLVSCFFGVLFMQNIEVKSPSASIGIPWDVPGGYPYMLCFDTETSGGEANRVKQLGLTLRRYKYGGSHDFTRWSTVEPTEETFVNSAGNEYESKIPDFYVPVTTDKIWDGNKHSVVLEWGNLSVENGDEKEAVKIEAWYDDVKVLTVIDEMPFKGESFGEEIDVDKRDKNGYIAVFAHHDKTSLSLENYGYKIRISAFTIEPGKDNEENGGNAPQPEEDASDKGCGCGGFVGFDGAICSVLLLLCASSIALVRVRKGGHRE